MSALREPARRRPSLQHVGQAKRSGCRASSKGGGACRQRDPTASLRACVSHVLKKALTAARLPGARRGCRGSHGGGRRRGLWGRRGKRWSAERRGRGQEKERQGKWAKFEDCFHLGVFHLNHFSVAHRNYECWNGRGILKKI